MSEFSQFIDKLRGLLPLSSVISRHVKIKRHGHEFQACCPFHNEKTPSFSINDQKGFYYCFGCGANGDVLGFTMDYLNLPFMEALKQLADMAGIPVPIFHKKNTQHQKHTHLFDVMEQATQFFQKSLEETFLAKDYLLKRGLSEEDIRKYRLGFSTSALLPFLKKKGFSEEDQIKVGITIARSTSQTGSIPMVGSSTFPRFRNRIMIPIYDTKGHIVAFGGRALSSDQQPKYMNSPETDLFHKSTVLFGLNQVKNVSVEKPIVVVEGYFDVITATQAGFNAVAPLGTAFTTEQMQILWRYTYDPILCFDGDQAGYKAMIRGAYHALPLLKPGYSLRFAILPVSEDPDSIIRKKGPRIFTQHLNEAKPMVDVLCDHYIKHNITGTPEAKARRKQEFLKLLESIQDKDIRRFYKEAFFEKVFAKKAANTLKVASASNHPTVVSDSHSPHQRSLWHSFDELSEKILLVTLINHPTLIPLMVEELVHTDFTLQGARDFIHDLIKAYNADGEDSVLLPHHPLCQTLKKDESFAYIAPFTQESASFEEASEGFLDVWKNYTVKSHLKRALEEHKKRLKQHWDSDTWNALKQIQTDLQEFSSVKEYL